MAENRRMEELRISHYISQTNVLGPYLRSALWVSGCCFQCEGCLAEEMNRQKPVSADIRRLADYFADIEETEGITISGGEPFLQADALSKLISGIRRKREYGVIVYTGFTLEELKKKKEAGIDALLAGTDILIDGRYQALKDDGKAYRGSSNQRILLLSERYRGVWESYYLTQEKRRMEIRLENGHSFMVGVPSADGLKTWRELKRKLKNGGNDTQSSGR